MGSGYFPGLRRQPFQFANNVSLSRGTDMWHAGATVSSGLFFSRSLLQQQTAPLRNPQWFFEERQQYGLLPFRF
jgi:hypothetical protein